ncbi:MAG TPA: Gfo/Idh/MocA family oxidoreductase [Sphingobacteriaceae bacterium]|nr:Gfo/Idh/MocA family oxidoreductase [Sphingobacteriaceae bacterium]
MKQQSKNNQFNRRQFVKSSGLLAGGLLSAPLISKAGFFNSVDDTIKVALIGCGKRGAGAAIQALSTQYNVKIVSMADAFKDRLDSTYGAIKEALAESGQSGKLQVAEENKFVGFDAYKKAMPLADVVLLTTPPGFRPIHFEEAVNQKKQIFMEKPVAVDPAGIQKILAAAQRAKAAKLNVVVGLQRHYQDSYKEVVSRIKKGMIGDVTSGQAWWNNDGVWVKQRQPGQTEMEYQMRNWYYFNWLCGDHINEQHVHNLDVMNWVKGAYPIKAQGMGGRQTRTGKEYGEIFDHHFVEYEYADGAILNSQCRHQKGTTSKVDELIIGTKGRAFGNDAKIVDLKGKILYQFDKSLSKRSPYQVEHDELFGAISKGEYKFADAENGAKSTMTAIMGRMATYSGQLINWDQAINSGISLAPAVYAWDAKPPVEPDAEGRYAHAVPGVTKYFV